MIWRELELLYCSILERESEGVVTVNDNLKDLLRAESTKRRDYTKSQILTKDLNDTAKSLKANEEIVIRKADKANVFIILDKSDYKEKLDKILEDKSKFKKTSKNTTVDLKAEVNRLITQANKQADTRILTPIIGEFSPGYIYGNVKIHKPNYPLRPIISQVPTPTYKTAKEINKIVTPFLPAKFLLQSTDQFLDLLQCTEANGFVASLDVESLFTNIPVKSTINIICNAVYFHPSKPPPPFSRETLEKLLLACTTKTQFKHIDGSLYYQIDGVAMGSPLGVTFANFYMCQVENEVIHNLTKQPKLYARYIDDCFIVSECKKDTELLRQQFEKHSVLKFTIEENKNKSLNFLDVHVEYNTRKYNTSVHIKPTHCGSYLNARSECPEKYKTGTIIALIHRIQKISSSWTNFNTSIEQLKQTLINNSYSNTTFDNTLKKYLEKHIMPKNEHQNNSSNTHTLYYKNQFSKAYKTDERILKSIIEENVKCTNPDDRLKLIIYYKTQKTSHLIMKNNLRPETEALKQTNVVYQFQCKHEDCEPRNISYIGLTTTTLSRRLTMHLQSGAIKNHYTNKHRQQLTRTNLVENTKIIKKAQDYQHLQILEALLIKKNRPHLNLQSTGLARTLHLHGNNH